MLAYMNAEALARTIETGEAHYWSRSRGRLWRKGEDERQHPARGRDAHRLRPGCASGSKVEMSGAEACCHTGRKSCFYRAVPVGEPIRQSGCRLALRRCRAAVRPGDRLPSRWCRKGNLKEFGVVWFAARSIAFGQADRSSCDGRLRPELPDLIRHGACAWSSMARPRLGIALGGGAARGWAHIGVLKTLVDGRARARHRRRHLDRRRGRRLLSSPTGSTRSRTSPAA